MAITLRSTKREVFISIDETMKPWRGKLVFTQYVPGKAHRYGTKMYKLATINGYTWNYLLYTGEQESTVGVEHAQTVVMNLLHSLGGCYRPVVVDNLFTTISLAKYLLDHEMCLFGTLLSNRVESGNVIFENDLSREDVYGLQNKDGVKLIRWRDTNNVLMISTRPAHSASVIHSGKVNFQNQSIMKPQVILDYNKRRQGIDLSNQLSTYYTSLRKSVK